MATITKFERGGEERAEAGIQDLQLAPNIIASLTIRVSGDGDAPASVGPVEAARLLVRVIEEELPALLKSRAKYEERIAAHKEFTTTIINTVSLVNGPSGNALLDQLKKL